MLIVEQLPLFYYNKGMFRLYVERKAGFDNEAVRIFSEIKNFLGVSSVKGVRYLNRYDVENVDETVANAACTRIFSQASFSTKWLS